MSRLSVRWEAQSNNTTRPTTNPFQFFGKPFERLIIDCVGPLPTVKTGHQCLLMIISASTCYPEAVPLRSIQAVTSLDVKLLFVFIFAFTCMLWISMLYFMLYCVQFFLSLTLSFWQCLIGTSCRRLRREQERLNAGKQNIVASFCGVCVVKLCCWCCAVPSCLLTTLID